MKHYTRNTQLIISFFFSLSTVFAQHLPNGTEWNDPTQLSLNKEQPRAWFFDFADTQEAQSVLPYNSSLWTSLDGTWKFHWAPDPDHRPKDFYKKDYDVSQWDNLTVPGCWNVQGIQKDGTLKYGVPIYCNQPVIFQHEVKPDDWRGGVMREPKQDWTTFLHRNEVGSYRRDFSVPATWGDKEIYIDFEGVNSFFYLWVNGQYVGFSENSRTTASFDITRYLNKQGENQLAVEVYRNSDGSFLEAQDMWRLPGIYRSVSLRAKSKIQVRDIVIRTTQLPEHFGGKAEVRADIYLRNLGQQPAQGLKMRYTIHRCKVWTDEIEQSLSPVVETMPAEISPADKDDTHTSLDILIEDAKLWSSEEPNRYIFVGELLDKDGAVKETFSTAFGIRKVEIRETAAEDDEFKLAGRYFYVNNMPIKFKGVNRQEINPETGNTITKEQIIDEIMLMRRGNINHVRTSHYSNMPYWFYACDKYGIMLEDEANIESHEYYYGKASLSHVPEFKEAHISRVMESAHAHVNHPCVIIWSLGNEAGPGENFVAAYQALHEFDPSRPVQYERNNDIVDMGSNQYPSIEWTRKAVTGTMEDIKYPFHISEYAHSMGNAGGNLEDYWEAIESTNFLCGGAIWDWVDQALYNYDKKTGQRYLAYGGDFGDKPNDGMFCMNGILFPDHTPKPEFEEVRHVYQYYGVKMLDAIQGKIEIFNKNYFIPMTDVYPVWSLWKDGVQEGEISQHFVGNKSILGPRERQELRVPYNITKFDPSSEYHLRVQFLLAEDKPWAKKGFVQAEQEFLIQKASITKVANMGERTTMVKRAPCNSENLAYTTDNGMYVMFSKKTGTIESLKYDGKEYIYQNHGPKLSAYRAPVDNDNWEGARSSWAKDGLHALEAVAKGHVVTRQRDGSIQLVFNVDYSSPRTYKDAGGASGHNSLEDAGVMPDSGLVINAELTWTIYPDGTIYLLSNLSSNDPERDLARIGFEMQLDNSLTQYSYYGKGPRNNYNDRCSGSMTAVYNTTVAEQFEPFPKPQDMANREEVRWCSLYDKEGKGLKFVVEENTSAKHMSVSVLPWSDLELTFAPHPYQLPEPKSVHLHLDAKVTGLGGNSCGQGGPLPEDCTKATTRTFGFKITKYSGQ